jgi:4-amino-4-deoxy-L-arabinose transferase-like glycosyltransferase
MWLSAGLATIFGVSEFIIRLPSALAGIACVALTVWYVYRRMGFVPAVASYVAIGLNTLHVWRSRNGDLDTLATLFFLCIFILILSKHKWRYVLLGVSFFLLYLTKLALVVLPVGIFVLYELIYNRQHWKKNLPEYVKLAAWVLIPAAIWIGLTYMQVGSEVFKAYIYRADAGAFEPKLQHLSTHYPLFAYYSYQKFFIPFLVWGLLCVLAGIRKQWNFVLFLFSTLLFIQLLFFERKNNWYLLPLFPFWAIAAGYGVQKILTFIKKQKKLPDYFYMLSSAGLTLVFIVLALRVFQVNIIPTFTSYGTTREMQSAQKAEQLSKKGDYIARLDHGYPSTVYYSNRRVLSSPENYTGNGGFVGRDHFISRVNLAKAIQDKKVSLVLGKKRDIESFIKAYSLKPLKIHATNDEEAVAQF